MRCTKCGYEVGINDNYCIECGEKIERNNSTNFNNETTTEHIHIDIPPREKIEKEQPNTETMIDKIDKIGQDNSPGLVIFLICIIVVALLIWFLFLRNDNNGETIIPGSLEAYEKAKLNSEKYVSTINMYSEAARKMIEGEATELKYNIGDQEYSYIMPALSKSCFLNESWTDEECRNFLNDIDNNYCRLHDCQKPSRAELIFDGHGRVSKDSSITYNSVICIYDGLDFSCN